MGDKVQKKGQAFLTIGVWTPNKGDETELCIQVHKNARGIPIRQPTGDSIRPLSERLGLGVQEWKKDRWTCILVLNSGKEKEIVL